MKEATLIHNGTKWLNPQTKSCVYIITPAAQKCWIDTNIVQPYDHQGTLFLPHPPPPQGGER